jgi:Tol biopolymer transport system component
VYDLRRDVGDRLTRDPIGALFPIWLRNGHLAFASARAGPWNLYMRSIAGDRGDQELYGALTPGVKYPSDVSPDGRFLLFHDSVSTWSLPLEGDRRPTLLTPGVQARISPNGRFLAYTAIDAGERHVYVTSFPEPRDRWRVSPERGDDPQWRRDGRELFYIDRGQTLVAVPIDPQSGQAAGPATPLFRAVFDTMGRSLGRAYAPSPDGQRFLVNERLGDDDYALWVTLNWAPTR